MRMKQCPSTDSTIELIRSLPTLSRDRLSVLWQQTIGKPAGSIRSELMIPVLAFRIQEKAYGGFDAVSKARLCEVAGFLGPKSRTHSEARRRFKSGTRIVREWRGKIHEVTLTEDEYEYEGKKYKSLSPIASLITGTHWSGPAFFGTAKKGARK